MLYTNVLRECPKGFENVNIKEKECYGNVFKFAERNRILFKPQKINIDYVF